MKTVRAITSLLLAGLVGGCAGGGETGTGLNTPDPIVSLGSISGFGSVYVNGVHFQTTGSSISMEDLGASESDLKIGMVVKIRGKIDADDPTVGVASAIEFEDELEGRVTAVSLDSNNIGTITVMGQTVHLDVNTIIDGELTVSIDNIVEVSGHRDGAGNIYATLVDVKKISYQSGDEIELKGIVGNLSDDTFTIGSQLVNFGSASIESMLQNDMLVEIKSKQDFSGGTLFADEIDIKSESGKEFEGEDGQEIELEGIITDTSTTPEHTITINGYTISVTDATQFTIGSRIEVEGEFDDNGNILAEDFKQRISDIDLEIEGYVTVDTDNKPNIVTVLGEDIVLNNLTIMKDERDDGYTPERDFNISHLSNNDWVEIRGYRSGDRWIATRLERDDDEFKPQRIKGEVTAVDATSLTIKDVIVINASNVLDQLASVTVGSTVAVEVDKLLIASDIN